MNKKKYKQDLLSNIKETIKMFEESNLIFLDYTIKRAVRLLKLLEEKLEKNNDSDETTELLNDINHILFDLFVLAYCIFEASIKKISKDKKYLVDIIKELLGRDLTSEEIGLFHLYRISRNELIHESRLHLNEVVFKRIHDDFKKKEPSIYPYIRKNIQPNLSKWFNKPLEEPNKLSEFFLLMMENLSKLHMEIIEKTSVYS